MSAKCKQMTQLIWIFILIIFIVINALFSSLRIPCGESFVGAGLVLHSSNDEQCPPNKPFLESKQTEINNTYTKEEIEEARRLILAERNANTRRYIDPQQLIRDVRLLMSIEDALKNC